MQDDSKLICLDIVVPGVLTLRFVFYFLAYCITLLLIQHYPSFSSGALHTLLSLLTSKEALELATWHETGIISGHENLWFESTLESLLHLQPMSPFTGLLGAGCEILQTIKRVTACFGALVDDQHQDSLLCWCKQTVVDTRICCVALQSTIGPVIDWLIRA